MMTSGRPVEASSGQRGEGGSRVKTQSVLVGRLYGVGVRRSASLGTACVPYCPCCPTPASCHPLCGSRYCSEPVTCTSRIVAVARNHSQTSAGEREAMEFDRQSLDEWAKDKPLSILQLDPADRAVLKIAGKCKREGAARCQPPSAEAAPPGARPLTPPVRRRNT
ncbi:hypothetical protein E2C01_040878 [Portunus trituberculatus]|uniref:Uncharacterized protein n=1 Tax=Portunus trituberculatus TaxID=210409 RepID=A0A5B7FKY2_PORTR|nr:hypothetical protein [Portunus trituberculatus]